MGKNVIYLFTVNCYIISEYNLLKYDSKLIFKFRLICIKYDDYLA